MEKTDFRPFTDYPPPNEYLLLEDHEGNIGLGFWKNKKLDVISLFPFGLPIRWSTLFMKTEFISGNGITSLCYLDGDPILPKDLYDEEPLFNDYKKRRDNGIF